MLFVVPASVCTYPWEYTHTHICVCTCMCNLVTVSDCDSIKFTSDLGVVVMGGLPWVHVVFYLEWAVVPFLRAETTLSFSSLSERTSLQSPSSRTLSSGFYTQLQPKTRQLLTWSLFTFWIDGYKAHILCPYRSLCFHVISFLRFLTLDFIWQSHFSVWNNSCCSTMFSVPCALVC